MAFIDTSLVFSSFTTPVAVTTTANSSVVDLTGAGSGSLPNMIGANGVNTAIGFDIGAGDGIAVPDLYLTVGTAFATGDGATLTVTLAAAPDNGSGSPSTYVTVYSSAVFSAANLPAATALRVPVPPVPESFTGRPRFYRLTYTVGTGTFSAGTVSAGLLLNAPSGAKLVTRYGSNFTSY